jgi:hypothetical protein
MASYEREVSIAKSQLASSKKWYINKLVEWYKNIYNKEGYFSNISNTNKELTNLTPYFFNGMNDYRQNIFIIIFDSDIKSAIKQAEKIEKNFNGYCTLFYDKIISYSNLDYQMEGGNYAK